MKYQPNYVYELTADQFVKIITRKRDDNDSVVNELIDDAVLMSSMQGSRYEPYGKKRPFSIPSAYYRSHAYKEQVQQRPIVATLNLPNGSDVLVPTFVVSGPVELSQPNNENNLISSDLLYAIKV